MGTAKTDNHFLGIDIGIDRLGQSFELNLLNLRHKLYTIGQEESREMKETNQIAIGLPNVLYMLEFLPFWRLFFEKLDITGH